MKVLSAHIIGFQFAMVHSAPRALVACKVDEKTRETSANIAVTRRSDAVQKCERIIAQILFMLTGEQDNEVEITLSFYTSNDLLDEMGGNIDYVN